MMSSKVFAQEDILGKALQVYSLRNEVIQNNIANVDTVGFKKSTVSFEDDLQEALRTRKVKDIDVSKVNPAISVIDEGYNMRMDGNNVDIDSENVQLYMNSVRNDAVANAVIHNFKLLQMGIMGR